MVIKGTKVKIFDNSGAKVLACFQLDNYTKKKYNQAGQVVTGSVVKYKSNRKVIKKQLCKSLIITSKKQIFRKTGNFVCFDEIRGVVMSSDSSKVLGSRIFGPASKEVKKLGNFKFFSLIKVFI